MELRKASRTVPGGGKTEKMSKVRVGPWPRRWQPLVPPGRAGDRAEGLERVEAVVDVDDIEDVIEFVLVDAAVQIAVQRAVGQVDVLAVHVVAVEVADLGKLGKVELRTLGLVRHGPGSWGVCCVRACVYEGGGVSSSTLRTRWTGCASEGVLTAV